VGHAPGQAAQAFQLLGLMKLGLEEPLLLFRQPAIRDVGDHADQGAEGPIRVFQPAPGQVAPEVRAIGTDEPPVMGCRLDFPRDDLAHAQIAGPLFGFVQMIRVLGADQVQHGHAEQLGHAAVRELDQPLGRHQDDAGVRGLEHDVQLLLALHQRRLGCMLLGNIVGHSEEQGRAAGRGHAGSVRHEPAPGSIGMADAYGDWSRDDRWTGPG